MDDSYTWQEETFEAPQLQLRIFKEAPVDGVAWRSGYSSPSLVINLSAQIQHFEVAADRRHRYSGPVIPGDFSFVPPHGELEGVYQGASFSYACLTFTQGAARQGFAGSRPVVMQSDPMLYSLVKAFYRQGYRNDPDAVLYRESLSSTLISHLQLVYLGEAVEPTAIPSLDRLERYIRENLDQKLTVAGLADLLNTTPKALQRATQETLGQSVYGWITALRLERSLDLLRSSDLGLTEIAARCGFANQSHWTRLFRRRFGVTPGRLRQ